MESKSSSNLSSCEDADRFIDAPEEFFYDCFSTHYDSVCLNSSPSDNPPAANLRRRRLTFEQKLRSSFMDTDMSSSSTNLETFRKLTTVEINDEAFGTVENNVDVTDSVSTLIDPFPIKGDDFEVIDSCGDTAKDMDMTDSGRVPVDPFHQSNSTRDKKSERFSATNLNVERREDNAGQEAPTSTDWSLLGLVVRSIEFQVSLMISFISFPPWLVSSCLALVFDPYRSMRRGRRYLLSKIIELCDLALKNHKSVLKVVRRLAWGLFWAVHVCIVLFALLAFALMVSGFVITHLAHEPLVIKESLNFDYTKNSPEAYVPLTSCAGFGFGSNCEENIETGKIRGLKVNPSKHRTEITVSMALPQSEYNRNLRMFQVRVDFLSDSGQILASSRRPCMIRFRSEPIRLVQTFLKMVPFVTGYASGIQTLNFKLEGFVEKDIIPTACLKIVIEQRAEFRPGGGIPEIYDAFLFLESKLPFFKRIIWNWRRTLFVWISMGLFIMELLFALVLCCLLIITTTSRRAQQRDRTHSINNNSKVSSQMGSR